MGNRIVVVALLAAALAANLVMNLRATPEGVTTGTRAPNFLVYSADGEPVELADFAGEHLFVNFWAWWCGPCIAEAESLYDLEQRLGGEVKFLYVGINRFYRDERPLEPSEIAEGYLPALGAFQAGLREATLVKDDPAKNRKVIDHLLDSSLFDFRGYWERRFRARTDERYGIPVTYLIDPQGKIELVVHTKQDWREHEQMVRDFAAGGDLTEYHSRFVIPPELSAETGSRW